MLTTFLNNKKAWKQFNQLYLSITTEKNKSKIEKYYDKADDWKVEWQDKDNQLVTDLSYILRDETKRKKEQLRNKPGRQVETDWIKSLHDHANRMNNEISVVQLISRCDSDSKNSINATFLIIIKSLEFSVLLVEADLEQIEKRSAIGELNIGQKDEDLIKLAETSLKNARKLIKPH